MATEQLEVRSASADSPITPSRSTTLLERAGDLLGARVTRAIERRMRRVVPAGGPAFALEMPSGTTRTFGDGEPVATVVVRDRRGLAALASMDNLRIGRAYLSDALDVRGDLAALLSLRALFDDRRPVLYALRFLRPLLFGQVQSDRDWISHHYDEDPAFFQLFLDRRHRAYSQGVFERTDEPLEDAMTRKLDFALDAIGARPGDRVLDIGGGWGSFVEHAGRRGVRVTSLTISKVSRSFIQDLIERQRLPCEVRLQHFHEHRAEPYDGIVNLGVSEHLPDYPAVLARYHALLKPGGHVYLDACACRIKYAMSSFSEREIFPGNGSPLTLSDYLTALARVPLELLEIRNDRENYLLTTRRWAENLDRHRDEIEARWGVAQYRRFRVYLWGACDGFRRDMLQAYRLVLRRPAASPA